MTHESGALIATLRSAPDQIARHRAAGLWRDTTIVDDLHHWATTMPDAPAILSDGRTVTYAALAAEVARFAGSLTAPGWRGGCRVAARVAAVGLLVLVVLDRRVGVVAVPRCGPLRLRSSVP